MMTTVTSIVSGFSNSPRIPFTYGMLACGHSSKVVIVGEPVDCERCDWQAKAIADVTQAIADGILSHTRMRPWCGVNQIHVYRRDTSSPTGVFHFATLDDTAEANAILRGALSPLSPTEGLR